MIHRFTHKSKHQRTSSTSNSANPTSPLSPTSPTAVQRSSSIASSTNSPISAKGNIDLKDRYDIEKKGIIASCFSMHDEQGALLESYITHVRITEDSHYPSSRPPPNQPESSKKHRTIILAVRKSGRVRVHKARENENGTYQIGKTWYLDELTKIENDVGNSEGFIVHLGKAYYWTTETSEEKITFIGNMLKIYRKYTKGGVPELKGMENIVDVAARTPSLQAGTTAVPPADSTSVSSAVKQGQGQQQQQQQQVGEPPSRGPQTPQQVRSISSPKPQAAGSTTANPPSSSKPPLNTKKSSTSLQGPPLMKSGTDSSNRGQAPTVPTTPGIPLQKKPSLPSLNNSVSPGAVAAVAAGSVAAGAAAATAAALAVKSSPKPTGTALTGPPLRKTSQGGPSMNASPQAPQTVRKVSSSSPSSTVKAMQARLQAQMNGSGSGSSSPSPKTASQTSLASTKPSPSKQSSTTSIPQTTSQRPPLRQSQSAAPSASSTAAISTPPTVIPTATPTVPIVASNTTPIAPTPIHSTEKFNPPTLSQSPPKQSAKITTKTSKAAEMHNKSKQSINGAKENLGPIVASAAAAATVGTGVVTAAAIAGRTPSPGTSLPSVDDDNPPLTTTKSAPLSPNVESKLTLPSNSTPDLTLGHRRNRSSIQGIKIFARSPLLHSTDEDDLNDNDSISLNEVRDTVPADLVTDQSQQFTTQTKGHRARRPSTASTMSKASKTRRLSMISNASAVEETLEAFNWNGREDVHTLEATITKELTQIEASNLHNVVDLDERIDELDRSLDSAVEECGKISSTLGFFSVQLGSFGDDISHIEGQGQGLQVQTTNQKTLWNELKNMLHTVSLSDDKLEVLTTANYDAPSGLSKVESAAIDLYKAVKAVRLSDGGSESYSLGNLKALREKRHIYDQAAAEFISRTKSYLDGKFKTVIQQSEREVGHSQSTGDEPNIQRIDLYVLGQLYPFSGIILFTKEIDMMSYSVMFKSYSFSLRQYYETAIFNYLAKWKRKVFALIGKYEQFSYSAGKESSSSSDSLVPKSLKRSGTIARFKSTGSAVSLDPPNNGSSKNGDRSVSQPVGISADDSRGLIDHADRKLVRRALRKIFEGLTSIVIGEQNSVTLLFHQSTFGGDDFPEYSKSMPLEKRTMSPQNTKLRIHGIDPDYSKAQELANNMGTIFDNWLDQTATFVDYYLSHFSLGAPALVAIIEDYLHKLASSNQDFLVQVLNRLKDRILSTWQSFLEQQISIINSTIVSSKKRKGVVIFVRKFHLFAKSIEEDLKDISDENSIKGFTVRKTVDASYEKVSKAIFHNLQRLAKDSGTNPSTNTDSNAASPNTTHPNNSSTNLAGPNDFEDKELLNYHIMMIENMNVLMESLNSIDNDCLQGIALNAQSTYRKEIDLYIQTVLHRPIGKLVDFIQGVNAIIDKAPNDNPSQRHGYSKSTFRKLVASYDSKEIRKGIETLRKRVEKHFAADDEDSSYPHNRKLLDKVWWALQAQYSVLYSDLTKIESKYYMPTGDSSHIEFTKNDISMGFSKV